MAVIDYRRMAAQAASKYGIDPNIFTRQIQAESGFNPSARSPVGATGIAQIMPATARGWGVNPNDPAASLDAAARNMSKYLRSYGGDWRKALAAYNAGPGAVQKYGGVPPYRETQNYISKILSGQMPISSGSMPNAPSGGDVPFSQTQPAEQGVNKAALLAAISTRGPEESLTSAVAKAMLQQRAMTQSNPEITYDPANTKRQALQQSADSGQGMPNQRTGGYEWAEALAKRFGLRLSSTYRSPSRNAAVGGSRTSAHMTKGAATDFSGTPAQMRALALAAIKSGIYREVFYDPVGQWDNGRFSKRGIGGHSDHVHITL